MSPENLDRSLRAACVQNAAPELYEALKDVMGWITAWNPNFEHDDEWPATRDKANAALASAEGRS